MRTGFFEHEHYTAMLKALPDYLKGALVMGCWTRLRRGEIVSMQWRQVDLVNGVLRLEAGTTKSGEARIVPLAPDLWECLKMQWEKPHLSTRSVSTFSICNGNRFMTSGRSGRRHRKKLA